MALKTVPFNVAFTFSRPNPADYEDINGDTQTAGTDVPRFNYSEGVGEGLLLDASLSETAAINDIPNFNSSSGTWVIKADLDKSMPIPGSGFGQLLEGSGYVVFVYSAGVGKCWANGDVLFTVDPFTAAEPGHLSDSGLTKIKEVTYYPYAWSDSQAAAKATGSFATYFSPAALFSNGEQGAWLAASDIENIFQDSPGALSISADNQVIGLFLDASEGAELGPDEFSGYAAPSISDSGGSSGAWDSGTGTLSNGSVGTSSSHPRYQWSMDSKPYWRKVTHTFTGDTGAIFGVGSSVGGVGLLYRSSQGDDFTQELSFYLPPGNPGVLQVFMDGTTEYSVVMDCTIQEIKGNHASQSTTAQKPKYRTDGTYHWVEDDLVDDALVVDFPDLGADATVAYADDSGVTILTGQTITGETELPHVAKLYEVIYVDRALTGPETSAITDYLESKREP
ncbi:hypothetical protein [Alcanivorax jadensis]|uniref:hypothetical protein n=1 Tax=Alcanivorax jadensis TaxID=64988 RepID=UPI0023533A65|nr:hypothetical protein [Alcanivorax jadensis]|tara:strand:- start:31372 stop:32724 length:1353 start_codon:yes stop_codon:yes gene_type:complete